MASKAGLYFVSLLFIFAVFTSTTAEIDDDDDDGTVLGRPRIYLDDCWEQYLKSTRVTVIGFDKIEKAVIESGRKFMAVMLRSHVSKTRSMCTKSFAFFVDHKNRFVFYDDMESNDTAVTLFVPNDESLRIEEGITLNAQIVSSRIDKRAFQTGSLGPGSTLLAHNGLDGPKVESVSENGTSVVISGAKITNWGIYDDGRILVHGTDDFFNHYKGTYFF